MSLRRCILLLAAIVIGASMALPWFTNVSGGRIESGVLLPGGEFDRSGWTSLRGVGRYLLLLAALAGLALAAGAWDAAWSRVVASVLGLAATIVTIVLISDPPAHLASSGRLETAFGGYVALAGALILSTAVWLGLAASRGTRTCPACAENVKPAAVICKHCGTALRPDLQPAPEHL